MTLSKSRKRAMKSLPKRYIMGFMCAFGMFQMYFARLVSISRPASPMISTVTIRKYFQNINIAILAMADAPNLNFNTTMKDGDVSCPENENYFDDSVHSISTNLSLVFALMLSKRLFDWLRRESLNLKTNDSISNDRDERREFTMANVQQMNLIGFYYHGYVPLHIISSKRFRYKHQHVIVH